MIGATLKPSPRQRRLAIGMIAVFAVLFAVTIPFKDIQLQRIDAFAPTSR
jgi:hypothetical protein